MSMVNISVNKRTDVGRKATKQLRKAGNIPAIVYGNSKDNVSVSLSLKSFQKFLENPQREVNISIDNGQEEKAVIKEVQYDPISTTPIHVDFCRI